MLCDLLIKSILWSVEARDYADDPLQNQHEVVRASISVLLFPSKHYIAERCQSLHFTLDKHVCRMLRAQESLSMEARSKSIPLPKAKCSAAPAGKAKAKAKVKAKAKPEPAPGHAPKAAPKRAAARAS